MAPAAETPTPPEEPSGEEEGGIFGNLPKTRPGARSPRRDAGASKPASAAPKREARRRAEPPPPPPRRERSAEEPEEPAPSHGGGLEDVAWAGVAAAAEAATIGVRLANRALEAMRGAVDRR
jgi:hypothetical protein